MSYESSSTPKILVAIVSCGTKNDQYLSKLIQEYRSMPFHVDIVVLSNLRKTVAPGVEPFLVDLQGKNLKSLPLLHKKIFADRKNDYDLFIYSEDDTLITEKNLRAFWKASLVLEKNEIPGFLRFERGAGRQINYPEVHGHFHWDSDTVRRRGEDTFASFTNEHCACYVLTRHQLQAAIDSGGFLVGPHWGKYDVICSAGTDPYTQCGFQKLIGISALDDFLVHHLSDTYVNLKLGMGDPEMRRQVKSLLQMGRNGQCPAPLFPTTSRLRDNRFSKDCYAPVEEKIVSLIGSEVRSVLSIGSGLGATEAALAKKGMRVVAIPVDPVFANGAKARGVEIIAGDLVTARKKLDGEQFDCLLLLDVLHLVHNPAETLSVFTPLLQAGARAIVQVPRISRLATLFRILFGDQRLEELGNYEQTGVHFTSRAVLGSWIEDAGLQMESTHNLLPSSADKLPRSLRWLFKPVLATKMGAKMVVVARKA